jgi:hypothetical protein
MRVVPNEERPGAATRGAGAAQPAFLGRNREREPLACFLAAAALLACFGPARRAASVPPAEAMRTN